MCILSMTIIIKISIHDSSRTSGQHVTAIQSPTHNQFVSSSLYVCVLCGRQLINFIFCSQQVNKELCISTVTMMSFLSTFFYPTSSGSNVTKATAMSSVTSPTPAKSLSTIDESSTVQDESVGHLFSLITKHPFYINALHTADTTPRYPLDNKTVDPKMPMMTVQFCRTLPSRYHGA